MRRDGRICARHHGTRGKDGRSIPGDSISVYPTFSVSRKVKDTILEYTRKLGLGIGIVGLYNIQFIVDKEENVYVIEVNPRSSRTVPFLSKATGYCLADIGTLVILGKSLREQGFTEMYPREKDKWYVEGARVLLLQDRGAGRVSLARDEIHRRGDRL